MRTVHHHLAHVRTSTRSSERREQQETPRQQGATHLLAGTFVIAIAIAILSSEFAPARGSGRHLGIWRRNTGTGGFGQLMTRGCLTLLGESRMESILAIDQVNDHI